LQQAHRLQYIAIRGQAAGNAPSAMPYAFGDAIPSLRLE